VSDLHDVIETAQDALSQHMPTRVILKAKSTAAELKSRLQWSEPALTIVDVRDPQTFNRGHIPEAISVPFARLGDLARSALPHYRDIYIYGESDEQSLAAAQTLQGKGFTSVSQIIGGLAAWHEVSGSTEC
jgi:rhodanese-related sulfurtransferase